MAEEIWWIDEVKKRLGYNGCRNCKYQIDALRACEWLESGGDGIVHPVCPNWERKDGKQDA